MFSKKKKPYVIDSPLPELTQGHTQFKTIESANGIFYFDNQRFSNLQLALNYAGLFDYKPLNDFEHHIILEKQKD